MNLVYMTLQIGLRANLLEYSNRDTYTGPKMGRKKTSGPPRSKRSKPNMVAAAIELAGGPTAVAALCGVRRQSVYLWIRDWKVERLVDALKLSQASGIPIEKLAGYAVDATGTKSAGSRPTQTKPDRD
jgi:hypothetical protein